MNIDKKLDEMEPKDTPLLVLGYILLGMMLLLPATANASDNVVLLDQQGDNVIIDVLQAGYDNSIDVDLGLSGLDASNEFEVGQGGNDNDVFLSIGGNTNSISFYQAGAKNTIGWTDTWGSGLNWGGDLDGDDNDLMIKQYTDTGKNIADNYFGFHIQGDNNNVKGGQGYFINSSTGSYSQGQGWGDHYMRLDIHGDNNDVITTQRTDAANNGGTAYVNVYADLNDLYVQQRQGAHTLNLTINNDSNDVWITQAGQPAHTATITLTGAYPTDLTVQQGVHATTTAQTYTLFQNCQTVGGCSISVTQQ
ncbi:hypothetical protein N9O93_00380 [bacterium]|nr:hypothetical protein [Hellea sp.]MDA9047919.1 hypothetical protein [Hellea sp.]MDA9225127.1 hypothetical protein [bacterium]